MVNVIIPNYNHAPYLRKRVDSVLSQTYRDFELILLDDNSSDSSAEVLNSYKHNEHVTRLIFNQENSGSPFSQWTKGIKKSKGKYIWIAESDDFCEPDFLQKCVNILEKDKDISLVFCRTLPVDVNDKIVGTLISDKKTGKYHAFKDDFFYNWFFLNDSFRLLNASACVFRRGLIEINEEKLARVERYRFSGDKLFWFILLTASPEFYYISESLNFQRQHVNTTRAKKGIDHEYLRNCELTEIYQEYLDGGNKADKNVFLEKSRRLLSKNIYGIFLGKRISPLEIIKSMYWIGFDLKFYKKTARIIMRGRYFTSTQKSLTLA